MLVRADRLIDSACGSGWSSAYRHRRSRRLRAAVSAVEFRFKQTDRGRIRSSGHSAGAAIVGFPVQA